MSALMAEKLRLMAEKLRAARERAGLTQRMLAESAGVAIGVVTGIEQGITTDPRVNTLRALARALGVQLHQLLDDGDGQGG